MSGDKSNMYDGAGTWNPFVGCNYNCKYCEPTFQRQLKRWAKGNCEKCYRYEPHKHPERLDTEKIPSEDIVFVCGNSDISFAPSSYIEEIIEVIKEHNERCPYKTYYFQSKQPAIFEHFKDDLPENCILLTTIETNRGELCKEVSNAPSPLERYLTFKSIDFPRKVLVVEPILDFDFKPFVNWILSLGLEYLWLGFNSRPEEVKLKEPPEPKVQRLVNKLRGRVGMKGKSLRGVSL